VSKCSPGRTPCRFSSALCSTLVPRTTCISAHAPIARLRSRRRPSRPRSPWRLPPWPPQQHARRCRCVPPPNGAQGRYAQPERPPPHHQRLGSAHVQAVRNAGRVCQVSAEGASWRYWVYPCRMHKGESHSSVLTPTFPGHRHHHPCAADTLHRALLRPAHRYPGRLSAAIR